MKTVVAEGHIVCYRRAGAVLTLEFLDDDLVHAEYAPGDTPKGRRSRRVR